MITCFNIIYSSIYKLNFSKINVVLTKIMQTEQYKTGTVKVYVETYCRILKNKYMIYGGISPKTRPPVI